MGTLSPIMNLSAYLSRIDYRGRVRADLDCLKAIHQKHLLNIPYENLDVQLGCPLDFDLERIFDKLVDRRRGGWCYEMNGLLGWALGEAGFDVMRMTGGVMRSAQGDQSLGNHLVLCVNLDGPHLADVGLGNGLVEPIPLCEGRFAQGQREFGLELLGEKLWRFRNFPGAIPSDFDFIFGPADEGLLARRCAELQTDPESLFMQNLICQRLRPDGVHLLLGRVLICFAGDGSTKQILNSADELAQILREVFDLVGIDVQALWPRVSARHQALFGDTAPENIELNPS